MGKTYWLLPAVWQLRGDSRECCRPVLFVWQSFNRLPAMHSITNEKENSVLMIKITIYLITNKIIFKMAVFLLFKEIGSF